jgi:hypothetical protein
MNELPDKIESLVDALSFVNMAYKADSLAYRLRNPALLRSFGRPGKNEIDENGYRIYPTFRAGYQSAVFDAVIKISGRSNSGINKTDLLRNLLGVYGINQDKDQTQVVSFLRKALQNPDISLQTPLSYFAEVKK